MTPEQQNSTPERKAEKPRVNAALEVVAKAETQHPATAENFKILDSHVDSLLKAADAGEITGSAGTYTRDKLLDQFQDFLSELKRYRDSTIPAEEKEDPFTRIPGKEGLRDSFRLLVGNDATALSFEESLRMHVEAHEKKRAELLSPENIQEMGEAELVAAEVPEPMAEARRAASGMIEIPDFVKNPSGVSAPAEVVAPQPAQEQAPEREETELEMNERFLRETQAELQELYAQHRQLTPGSWEADSVANQIKYAKEDAGKFAKKVANLKGQNWT